MELSAASPKFETNSETVPETNGAAEEIARLKAELALTQNALREANARLDFARASARVFDSNVVGVIRWNLDSEIITDANDLFLEMTGYTREDLAAGRLNWRTMTPPEWTERNERGVGEIRDGGKGKPYEKEYFRKDGSRVPIVIGGALFENTPNEGMSFILDISERKAAERTQDELNARLRRAMQETHHRIKNNLQLVSALIEMLGGGADANDPALQRIRLHVRNLAAIHDLLTQQAKRDSDLAEVSARAVLNKLIPMLEQTSGGRIFRASVDDFLLPVREASSLALLVSECVSNALKHGVGSVDISLCAEGGTAVLQICDDGDGFPFNFDPATAANTGLELIENAARWDLRGDVAFDNREIGGARVTVRFPIA